MKLKTTIEELEKSVHKKYPFIKGICVFRKNNSTYGQFYNPDLKQGKGSYNEPYEWRRDHILNGNFTIENHSWNKERANKIVLKKYPHLKYCGQYLNKNSDAIIQYYDETIKQNEKGSLENPYTLQAKHLLDGQFSIGEKIWTKEQCDSYIHKIFPFFCFIKIEYLDRKNKSKDGKNRRDSYAVYYNPNKENGYGSINNPYFFSTSSLLKGSYSLRGEILGEVICEEMINTFTNNYVFNKETMKGTKLRPDFTLYDYNTYIEINGYQHYINSVHDNTGKTLKERIQRDNRKINFSRENNNWNLIVLPNPYDRNVPQDKKIKVYLSDNNGLEVLKNLKNSGYDIWFKKFDVSIN